MIATSRFVHIHLHKSGGTFVNEAIRRFFPEARVLGYHLPRRLIPPDLRALPVIGFVRNPWSYYVSWYAFQSARPTPNALFRIMSANGTLDFNATIRNLVELGSGSALLDPLLAALPDRYGGHGINLPSFALEPIRGSGRGFFSFLFQYMYGDGAGPLHLGRTETLRRDLLALLDSLDVPVTKDFRAFVETEAARNTSSHADASTCYDSDTARLVGERDREIVEAFGYRFG